MRVSFPSLAVAAALATLVAGTPVSPATAGGPSHSIAVSPATAKPGEAVTVTGTSSCPSSAYTVTLTYTNPEGDNATVTASGTTTAEGAYTQPVTVPETAVAGEPASVQSNIPACGESAEPPAAPSETDPLTIEAHDGTLTVTPTSGPTGTQVQISGTNCYGGEVVVAFTDGEDGFVEVEPVTLNPDRTFSATWAITDQAGPGQYFFVAECPGTDYDEVMFTVTARPGDDNTGGGLPPAPPAVPVPGTANFTG